MRRRGPILLLLPLLLSAAAELSESYSINLLIGDGKNGRVSKQWRQDLPERPLQRLVAVVQRRSGGDQTFLNLQFGNDPPLENGKRIYLRDRQPRTVSWETSGERAQGRALVLNAFEGEVFVEKASVFFAGETEREFSKPASPGPIAPIRPPSGA